MGSGRKLKANRSLLAGFAIVLIAYFALLVRHNCFFAAGPDSSGYCNEAKLLASGHMTRELRLMERLQQPASRATLFLPLGFTLTPRPFFTAPSYPAGMPFHQALLAAIGGWKRAPFLVNPIAAVLCAIAMMLLACALGLEIPYAIAAAGLLMALPSLIVHAIQPTSDILATFYAIAAMALAVKAKETFVRPALAGFLLSAGAWVRPTNLLLVIPLVIALRFRWRPILITGLASLPLGGLLAWWQWSLYGSPLRTGYGTFKEMMRVFPGCAIPQLGALGLVVSPFVIAGAVAAWLPIGALDVRHRVLLAVWFLVFFVFYSYYGYCEGWVSSRFLLPAIPALILSFIAAIRRAVSLIAAASTHRFAATVGALVILCTIGLLSRTGWRLAIFNVAQTDSIYPGTVQFVESRLPPNAIVTCGLMSGAFLYYAGRETVRWDEITSQHRTADLRAAARKLGLQWYAVESSVEVTPSDFDEWRPAHWVPAGVYRDVTLWKLVD